MAVVTKERLLEAVKLTLGENTSDEAIKLIEDITDTIANYESLNKEDWKTKYEENDRTWRERYRNRFYAEDPASESDLGETDAEEKDTVILTYDQLFKEES